MQAGRVGKKGIHLVSYLRKVKKEEKPESIN